MAAPAASAGLDAKLKNLQSAQVGQAQATVVESNELTYERKQRGLESHITGEGNTVNFHTRQGENFQVTPDALPSPSAAAAEEAIPMDDEQIYSPSWTESLPKGTSMMETVINGRTVRYLSDGAGAVSSELAADEPRYMLKSGGSGESESVAIAGHPLHGDAIFVAGHVQHPRTKRRAEDTPTTASSVSASSTAVPMDDEGEEPEVDAASLNPRPGKRTKPLD
ncbi:uncharacterized protein AMSG_04525 [Thecamonas trahens ATCC 50062]|uniref:Uncharacterized protein n=1 Tax=Thecamonas trahens ATCC 50062 TaxID=461836 RepID=A0A0L0D7G3_THETB|nr:hypothetical protein AMSG_04525 [Thecamonas trahens ATCC 50062]KNC48294.1 hypothetical protein AMSG_04525 [Thecamonas trahens ATCC 50062]|eukprot:XP_013758861.1 hypothetical protein AMSG_04525 [Thecamonas trahens ATCC 50062]